MELRIAKAVVTNASASGLDATSICFMKKKYDGYDSGKNNWAYAIANLKNGKLEFQETQGKLTSCNACHMQAKEWDFVKTVDYFQRQSIN